MPATHSPRVEQVTGQCERGARLRSCARVLMRVLGHRLVLAIILAVGVVRAGGAAPLQPGVIAESARKVLDAAKHLDAETLHSLITQGADVSVAEGDGTTALHWAVHGDDLATVDVLLRAGAHADATNDYGVTPLSLACTNGSAASSRGSWRWGAIPTSRSRWVRRRSWRVRWPELGCCHCPRGSWGERQCQGEAARADGAHVGGRPEPP